jgi:hypothetical protein
MFESVVGLLSEASLAYVLLFAIAAGDAIVPVLPSESVVILAGVLSAAESELVLGELAEAVRRQGQHDSVGVVDDRRPPPWDERKEGFEF